MCAPPGLKSHASLVRVCVTWCPRSLPRAPSRRLQLHKEGILNGDILRCLSHPDSDKIKATVARGIKTDPQFLMVGGGGGSRASSRASSRAGGGFGRRPRRSSQERDRPPGSAGSSGSGRRSRTGDDDDDHAGSGSGISTRGARGSRGRVRRRVGSGPPMSATASSDLPQGREFTTLVEKMNSGAYAGGCRVCACTRAFRISVAAHVAVCRRRRTHAQIGASATRR